MTNGWTGGQYSAWRMVTGIYLTVIFARLVPYGTELFSSAGMIPAASASPYSALFPNLLSIWDSPAAVRAVLLACAGCGILFTIGLFDRIAAVLLWYGLACLFGRNPLILNPSLPYIGWLLLAHATIRAAPNGSWRGRGRADPAGGWHMPGGVFRAAWIIMALGYSYSGYTKLVSPSWMDGSALAHVLQNPLARPTWLRIGLHALPDIALKIATWAGLAAELLFAPLALIRRLRPMLWTIMLLMHLMLIALVDFAELSLGMVILHLYTFDPAWVHPRRRVGGIVFYDGHCGLCHRFARFLLAEDSRFAPAFSLAPLDGATFAERFPSHDHAALPDSVIVQTADGHWLYRSGAVLHVLSCLGGYWRIIAIAGALLPRWPRDAAYDAVAKVRHALFRRPTESCPLMAPHMRGRFLP